MNNLLVLLSLSVFVVSCGKNTSGRTPPTNRTANPITVENRQLEVTQLETVNFVRQKQMISRYNCNGQVTSRKLETLNSLSAKITIDYHNRKKAWDYSVYNLTTKSGNKGAFTKDGRFMVDYAPTVFNMRVKSGINLVHYKFDRCTKIGRNPQGHEACVGQVVLEKEGIVQLDVYYSSTTLPGEQHIRPTAESCKPRGR